jgi:hypothetical protein
MTSFFPLAGAVATPGAPNTLAFNADRNQREPGQASVHAQVNAQALGCGLIREPCTRSLLPKPRQRRR